jgi:hypothetical protein
MLSKQTLIKTLFIAAAVTAVVVLFAACPQPDAAPVTDGTVKGYQKISATKGSFTGILDGPDRFGSSITPIGDLDGNGVSDIAVGAYQDDTGGSGRGAVWILFLRSDATVSGWEKIGDSTGGFTGTLDDADFFGGSVASLGDLDGDGIVDIAVGAPGDDDGGTDRGAIWILFLNTDGTVKSFQKISDTSGVFGGALTNDGSFGNGAASAGDLNGDGTPDLAVGAPNDDDGGSNRGAVWILFLASNGTVSDQQKISATAGGFTGVLDDEDSLGVSLTSPGDIDGDGIQEIVTGVPFDDDGGSQRGAVWVLFLSNDGTVDRHQKISSSEGNFTGTLDDGDYFGTDTGSPGDLDNNGVPDLVVGANLDDDGGSQRGAVWVLFLNNDGTVASHQKISDTKGNFAGTLEDNDSFGLSVAAPGDVDGDGIADIAVGATDDDGAVWVLFLAEASEE